MLKLVLVLGLAAASAVGGWFAWRLVAVQTPNGFVDLVLGDARLRIHASYARASENLVRPGADRIDLVAGFPDFRPAAIERGRGEAANKVFIRLQPKDTSLDPEERAAKLYVRFLEHDQWSHPGGLAMRRFEPGSPYEREELYFAPPEGRLFTARCMRPTQPPDGLPNTCLTEFRARGLDIQLRYSPDLLPEWERLMGGARGLVESIAR